ncbi:hypothetical protein CW368_02080 [Actinomycetales bacterium SN12]|nr:hypothetical protein CW368_02080 [Actinomycetales bacterium SN12]
MEPLAGIALFSFVLLLLIWRQERELKAVRTTMDSQSRRIERLEWESARASIPRDPDEDQWTDFTRR